jgi:hypothetical protein
MTKKIEKRLGLILRYKKRLFRYSSKQPAKIMTIQPY